MADNESFFRKVVRFVANPATDWTELSSRQEDTRELELEKSELKAMIERKRRNDFVRKREFDMLRRVRRDGLSPEQLAALGTSSRLDDSEARLPDHGGARPSGVKAKIDEIEQQMVGDAGFASTRNRPPGFFHATTTPADLGRSTPSRAAATPAGAPGTPRAPSPAPLDSVASSGLRAGAGSSHNSTGLNSGGLTGALSAGVQAARGGGTAGQSGPTGAGDAGPRFRDPRDSRDARDGRDSRAGSLPPLPVMNLAPPAAPSPVQMASGLPPLAPLSTVSFDTPGLSLTPRQPAPAAAPGNSAAPAAPQPAAQPALQPTAPHPADHGSPFAVEVSEVVHDPELDEAVISFANADFTQCEESLQQLTEAGGARHQHAETWLVLFDLYRATGQQQRFESLAVDYAQQFGWSAPQWYSLPKLVADALAEEPIMAGAASTQGHGDVGWISPALLDIDAVARLRSQTLQMPLPWVFDWSQLKRIDAEAAMQLSMLMRLWSGQALELRWLSGERLFAVLQDAAPTGVRDADPAFWLTRLDALRLANRPDQFDEAAIDYCVTYEVSPPSWEPTRCKVHISGSGLSTRTPPMSMVSEVSTSFMESSLLDDGAGNIEVAHVELSGQLVGDIGATLSKLQSESNVAPVISVSCARLIRVDFLAAGDLLNWVLSKRSANRAVHFVDTHRLVALFFGAMGINEHAKVQVRKV